MMNCFLLIMIKYFEYVNIINISNSNSLNFRKLFKMFINNSKISNHHNILSYVSITTQIVVVIYSFCYIDKCFDYLFFLYFNAYLI